MFHDEKDIQGQEVEKTSQETPEEQETLVYKQEAASWKEQYLRSRADFENFTKRVEKERTQVASFAQNEFLGQLLLIVDDFERAFSQEQGNNDSAALAGFILIHAAIKKLLEHYGVVEMAIYESFDPSLHDAISQIPVEGKASGAIVHVAQKGYLRNGVVLRPAKVVVAQ